MKKKILVSESTLRNAFRSLYKEFGVNAEFLIDHAHGIEPCTIEEIHNYKSKNHSLFNSQILFEDYKHLELLFPILGK